MVNIRKYYKGQHVLEMCRLKTLLAVFWICYGLRALYQYELGSFRNFIKNQVVRWHFLNLMPLFWDISSVLSILVMHHFTFKSNEDSDKKSESSKESYQNKQLEIRNVDNMFLDTAMHER